ncbi:hypothetical protein AMJ80_07915 [bacterium SM23_31]|nr:MAG: hypothetical protein AMJ80_07915 [bacterium SM23_31]
MNKYLTPHVCKAIADEIAGNKGNEVFFHGFTDKSGLVYKIEALAWGNETATPAILQHLAPGDVVIHNHPSGDITPSEADIQIASILGSRYVGFYIVDNSATNLKIVVKRLVKTELKHIDPLDVSAKLDSGSAIAHGLPGYELRTGQIEMAVAATNSFNEGTISMIEAGTGTGKTLAYLIPAILWARKNKERIVVSTNTINLQEQLVFKDIPLLKKSMDEKFTSVLVKGRANYCCLRKVDAEEKDLGLFKDEEDYNEMRTLIAWSKKTKDGSLSDLNFIPKSIVWDRLKCESDTCTGARCAFYEDCFLVSARREAARSDILIINHHLLFSDLSLRGSFGSLADIAVLPPYTRIIIDEAQHIEKVSTDYFGRQVSHIGIKRLFGRLMSLSKKGERKGLLPVALAKLRKVKEETHQEQLHSLVTRIEQELLSEIMEITDYSNDIFSDIESFLQRKAHEHHDEKQFMLDERFFEDPDWTDLILVKIGGLITRMREFRTKLFELVESLGKLTKLLKIDMENLFLELKAHLRRINDTADSFQCLLFETDENVVKWIELTQKYRTVKICAAPIEVGESLRNALFTPYYTVILTSATLTVGGSFDFIKSRLGIDMLETEMVTEHSFPSPFDFRKQALIGIPTNNYPPDHPQYFSTTPNLIAESLKISRGRAFVLFTSYQAMNEVFNYISVSFENTPINLLKQGTDTRHNLLNRFRKEQSAALFATDSFWEGVDVMGEALESIIIARLPFRVPTEPIEIARRDAIDRAGGNSFLEYTVPTAVIKFKQGFGRLIRHKNDRGTILVLDNRIVTKSYGKVFLDSLPDCRIVADRDDVVFKAFREFYNN